VCQDSRRALIREECAQSPPRSAQWPCPPAKYEIHVAPPVIVRRLESHDDRAEPCRPERRVEVASNVLGPPMLILIDEMEDQCCRDPRGIVVPRLSSLVPRP
jgi:hypothetical protein